MVNAQGPREVELKLELDHSDVPRMRELLAARFGEGSAAVRLSSVYYDTPAQDLAAERIVLRVRRQDGTKPVQTVKRSRTSQAGLFQRDEWETELAGPEPDLGAYARTDAADAVPVEAQDLAPIFETIVDRSVWQIVDDDDHVEIALDEGHVVAGQRTEPLAEIELELKRGSPRVLFRFIEDLGAVASLRPGVLAKSERGFRLARAKPPSAAKAEPLHLSKHMSAAEAFRQIGHACLRHFGLNAPLIVDLRAPGALHQARVALRRLRSAISLFKGLVAHPSTEALKVELRDLAAALGEARNLDVYLSGAAREEVRNAGDGPRAAAFLAEMERRRSAAYDAVVARLESAQHRSLMLRLLEWLEAGSWLTEGGDRGEALRSEPIRVAAARILDKRRRRVKRLGRGLVALDPHARHRVRIEAKKLRYAAEFFAGLAPKFKRAKRHARFVAVLEDLQEQLGALNDIQTGQDIARSLALPEDKTAPAVALLAAPLDDSRSPDIEGLLKAAETAHARLVAAKRFWSGWAA